MMMVFGEIDIRCHIKKIADRKEISPDEVIKDLAGRFCQGVQKMTQSNKPKLVVICEVMPTVDITHDPKRANALVAARYPVIGTDPERVHYNTALNKQLKEECRRYGFAFFEYGHLCKNEYQCLNADIADRSVHISQNHRCIVQNALKQFLANK